MNFKAVLFGFLAAVPASTNFILESHDFGAGAANPSSSSYNLQASNGSLGGDLSSGSYALPVGVRATNDVAVPPAPTFANPDSSYNRLKLTLNVTGMPTDAKYLIAISDDNFVTTNYVQTDQTVGSTAGIANYQTYAAWGGASGFWILGLDYGTTYKVKVAALQGAASGSAFGPTATTATVEPSVTFAVTTSLSGTPPFATSFTSLAPGIVTSGNATVIADVTTNAMFGGDILLKSQNAGLASVLASNTLVSATADLSSANHGYGAQIASTAQGSGGPMTATAPFNGSSGNVGGLTTSWQQLASFSAAVTSGNVTLTLKAKADAATPAATDYSDILTLNVSLLF
jgi:hypothetical protein